jgi:hypothetical protein
MNEFGIGLLIAFNFLVALMLLTSQLFIQCRRTRMASLQRYGKDLYGKELIFHSPDDSPRSFRQYGLLRSRLGSAILFSWQAIFVVGWIYCIFVTWVSYAPRFGAPTIFLEAFGGWAGLAGPWCVIFTEIQLLGIVLIYFWSTMKTHFMFPVGSMVRATHVMIEEVTDFNTDDSMEDPDANPKGCCRRLQGAAYRTCLPILTDPDGTRRIEYTCVRYIYRPDEDAFCPVGIESCTPVEAHAALAEGGLSHSRVREVMASCGQNEIHVHVPGIWEALLGRP